MSRDIEDRPDPHQGPVLFVLRGPLGPPMRLPVPWYRMVNRENMAGRIVGWKQILNTVTIHYGDRIEAVNQ